MFKFMIAILIVNSTGITINNDIKKVKLENLIQTKSSTTSSTPLSSTSIMTIDDSIEINNLIQNETFFSRFYLNKSLQAFVEFKFTHKLVHLLNRFETNLVRITIRNYSSKRLHTTKPFFTLNTNLIVNITNETMNADKVYCSDKYGPRNFSNIVCFKLYNLYNESNYQDFDFRLGDYLNYLTNKLSQLNSVNNSKTNSSLDLNSKKYFLFSSLIFKMKYSGNFVICIKFINNLNPHIQFFAENMCFDWIAFKENNISHHHDQITEYHNFHYKPLFILIMYLLCASLLLPIAIAQYIMTKSNNQAKKNIKQANKEENATDVGGGGGINSNLNKADGLATLSGSRDSSVKNLDSKIKLNELEPLIKANALLENENIHPTSSSNKKVLFRLNSTDSFNSLKDANENDVDYSEAKHILDDKPWARGSSAALLENTVYNSNSPIKSNISNIARSQSILDINESKINPSSSSDFSSINVSKLKKRNSFRTTSSKLQADYAETFKNKLNSNERLNNSNNEKENENENLDRFKSASQKIIQTVISDQTILQIELVNIDENTKHKTSTNGSVFESNV